MLLTEDDQARRAAIVRYLECAHSAERASIADEMYHEDAVLEFPQSGERFEGLENFRVWREQYPANVEFRSRRIVGSGELWVSEASVRYDGGPWMFGVAVLEFDGMKVRRERIYGGEPWEAPDWRAPWRAATPADP